MAARFGKTGLIISTVYARPLFRLGGVPKVEGGGLPKVPGGFLKFGRGYLKFRGGT